MMKESKRISEWWGSLNIILNSSISLLKIYISWAWIKEDLIFYLVEKIWGKKEF